MKPTVIGNEILNLVKQYRNHLIPFNEDHFRHKPSPSDWSLSEIYFHIFDASVLSLRAVEYISEGIEEEGKETWAAKIIFLLGRMPGKFKAPRVILNRVKSISIVEANQLIDSFETKLTFTLKLVDLNSTGRVKHPRLGALTSKQWLKFIEIHLKHHLKQVERTKIFILEN